MRDVSGRNIRVRYPFIYGETDQHRLEEVDVEDANDAADGHLIEHGGRFQTNVLPFNCLQKRGQRGRLRETGDERSLRSSGQFTAPQKRRIFFGGVQVIER